MILNRSALVNCNPDELKFNSLELVKENEDFQLYKSRNVNKLSDKILLKTYDKGNKTKIKIKVKPKIFGPFTFFVIMKLFLIFITIFAIFLTTGITISIFLDPYFTNSEENKVLLAIKLDIPFVLGLVFFHVLLIYFPKLFISYLDEETLSTLKKIDDEIEEKKAQDELRNLNL